MIQISEFSSIPDRLATRTPADEFEVATRLVSRDSKEERSSFESRL